MKSFLEEYGKTIIVAIVIVGLILVATLFATDGKASILDIFRHLRGPSYEMIVSPSKVTKGEDATFVSDAPFDKFKEVRIDRKVVNPDNYTASSEPTKITLKGSYTETLDKGKHTIEIISDDGYAEAGFKVLGDPAILVTGIEFNAKIPSGTTSVIFTDTKAPDGATLTDVSQAQDGSIVAWLDGTTYKVSTQESEVKVYANPDSSYMFNGDSNSACSKLTSIDCSNLDTSLVTSMSHMFTNTGYSASTFSLDLSGWDTSKVTNMSNMFHQTGYKASTFEIKGLSGWDTSSVTDMSWMFKNTGANASTWSIGDLSGWDTSSVTYMPYMFSGAGYKASTWNIGDLSNWNTSSVTNMSYMFRDAGYNASGWHINCSSWDVGKVTSHNYFNGGVTSKVTEPAWVN